MRRSPVRKGSRCTADEATKEGVDAPVGGRVRVLSGGLPTRQAPSCV